MPKSNKILIVGGGFVGLTLAAKILKNGNAYVSVLENNSEKLDNFSNHNFGVFEPGLNDIFMTAIAENRLEFITYEELDIFEAVFICIGTSSANNNLKSMDILINFAVGLSNNISTDGILFIRSTVRVGTTNKIRVLLSSIDRPDINVTFVPERTIEGNAIKELDSLPQILAAFGNKNLQLAKKF
jgi:UDP-N-acetyl-D-mannosaminuronic acid dehydrogenase